MRLALLPFIVLTLVAASSVSAQTTTLYDGAGNLTPDQAPWNWTYAQSPATPDVKGAVSNGATILDTTAANNLKAGYARFAPAPLDNATGYEVAFDLQVLSEAHTSSDRAGCDVIVLGNDHKGVELAFWTNQVWAQSDIFTHATGSESRLFDTTARPVHYTLRVAANAYTLTADAETLLSGRLHSYPALPGTPYGQDNFLFVGDDTTSANARFSLSRVMSGPISAVPESGLLLSFALALSGGGLLYQHRRRAITADSSGIQEAASARH